MSLPAKTIAYLRVSTIDQNLDKNRADILRLANEKGVGQVQFIEEQASGGSRRKTPYQIGEKPVSVGTVQSVLSPDLNTLEPNLARCGYSFGVLCEKLNIKRHEIKAYLRGQLNQTRLEEINKEIHKLGVLV